MQWKKLRVKHSEELAALFAKDDNSLAPADPPVSMNWYFDLQKQHNKDTFFLKLAQEYKQVLVSELMTPKQLDAISQGLLPRTAALSEFVSNA